MRALNSTSIITKIFNCLLSLLIVFSANSQTVHLIPNPSGFGVVVGSEDKDFPIFYKNNLIIDESNGLIQQLAKYGGNKITLISNPDNGHPFIDLSGFGSQHISFNNKLYVEYQNSQGLYQLAQYDGDTLKLISNPDGYELNIYQNFIIYQNKIYLLLINLTTNAGQLGVFDGNNLLAIPNPDAKGEIDYPCPAAVYKGKLYFYYTANSNSQTELTSYDGNNFTSFSNPLNTSGVRGSAIVYNGNLFFPGDASDLAVERLLKFDGANLTAIPNDNYGSVGNYAVSDNFGLVWEPFIDSVNNQLCFEYTDFDSYEVNLCKYDDMAEIIIPNPTPNGFSGDIENFPIKFSDTTYINYENNLTKYDGKILTVIKNPNNYDTYFGHSIQYGNNLYLYYYINANSTLMGKFNGDTTSIVPNTNGYLNHPIIYNKNLYGYYINSNNTKVQLGYLDTSSVLALSLLQFAAEQKNNNVVLNWQTETEANTSYFNVQRSSDGLHFNTINKIIAAGNSSSIKAYSYTDAEVNELDVSKLYYRLQEVDKDGKNNYSNVRTIDFTKGYSLFTVSPNPSKDFINIVSSYNVADAQIKVTDMSGKTLFTSKQDLIAGQQLKVSLSKFPSEVLFVTIISNDNHEQFKIIKE